MAKRKVTTKEVVEDSVSKPSRDDKANGVDGLHTSKKTSRKRKVTVEEDQDIELPAPSKKSKKRKLKVEEEEEEEDVVGGGGGEEIVEKKVKKKRKTKEEKAAEAMPIASRTIGHKLFIGAHVSSAGGQYI